MSRLTDGLLMRSVVASVATAALALSPAAGRQAPRPGNDAQRSTRSVLDTSIASAAFTRPRCRRTVANGIGARCDRRRRYDDDLYVRDVASGESRRVTAAADGRAYKENGVAWSSDSRTLAFLSDAASPDQRQVWVLASEVGGAPHRLTSVTGQLAHPLWSPDGRQLAVMFVAGSTQETGTLVAYKPDTGVVGDVVEEQRIAVVDPSSGNVREVSPPNLHVYDYDWSTGWTGVCRRSGGRFRHEQLLDGQLYIVRADNVRRGRSGGRRCRSPGPRWSPDAGRWPSFTAS